MTKPDSPKPMSIPAEWCDACKAEEPIVLVSGAKYAIYPRRASVCTAYDPMLGVCHIRANYYSKTVAIAAWERATGRQWPEGTG